jgi:hypothetical protein
MTDEVSLKPDLGRYAVWLPSRSITPALATGNVAIQVLGGWLEDKLLATLDEIAGPLGLTSASRRRSVTPPARDEWIAVCLGLDAEYESALSTPVCADRAGRNERCPHVS